jgi:hypothetical protein
MRRAENGPGVHDIEALRTGGARFIHEPCRLSGGESVMAVWSLLRETASRWSGHKTSLLGAAIAYYSVFSLGPLMVIAIAIAGFVWPGPPALPCLKWPLFSNPPTTSYSTHLS